MLHFPDLHHLSFVLKKRDHYPQWAELESRQLDTYQQVAHGSATLYHKEDAFDSHLFGFSAGKVEYVFGDEPKDILFVVEQFMKEHPYEYVLFRTSQDNIRWIQEFERNHALLLDTTIELVAVPNLHESTAESILREASEEDIQSLQEVAYSYSHGRFFTDLNIQKGTEMYLQWIENSVRKKTADHVYIYEKDGETQGFVSIKASQLGGMTMWKIPLVGKHPSSVEPNVATRMLKTILTEAKKQSVDAVLIATQGTNIAAIRSYHSAGFSIYATGISMGWKRS